MDPTDLGLTSDRKLFRHMLACRLTAAASECEPAVRSTSLIDGAFGAIIRRNSEEEHNISAMAEAERFVRQSMSIPTGVARRVRALATTRKASANRVLVDLIEAGLQSKEAEKERFFLLVNRLTESSNVAERQRVKGELARMTFGD